MVTKNIITQYIDLKQEAKDICERIKKIENQIKKIENEGCVVDVVRGGEGNLQTFKIEGFPYSEYNYKKYLLITRKLMLSEVETKILETINVVEEFILGIDDSHIRRIITYRIIDDLSWNEVACKMGGGNTEDSVKKIFYRFMEKTLTCPICPEKI